MNLIKQNICILTFFCWTFCIFILFHTPRYTFIHSLKIKGNLSISIDKKGIPIINGTSENEAYFGLGYMHAKDRLIQIFMTKLFATGSLSQFLGKDTLEIDKTILNLRFDENAIFLEKEMDPKSKVILESYVNGINEYVNNLWVYPIDFYLLGIHSIPPFQISDSLRILKIVTFTMECQWALITLRTVLQKKLGLTKALEILPINDFNIEDEPVYSSFQNSKLYSKKRKHNNNYKNILHNTQNVNNNYFLNTNITQQIEFNKFYFNRSKQLRLLPDKSNNTTVNKIRKEINRNNKILSSFNKLNDNSLYLKNNISKNTNNRSFNINTISNSKYYNNRKGGSSNHWVVSGNLTNSGYPILSGDPHLSTDIPGFFYLISISYNDYYAQGATIPGFPSIIIGRNNFFSWSLTMSMLESLNIFEINMTSNNSYKYGNKSLDFLKKNYSITIRNEKAFNFISLWTIHGPFFPNGITESFSSFNLIAQTSSYKEPFAMSWGGFNKYDYTIMGLLNLDKCQSKNEIGNFFNNIHFSGLNILFATINKTIGGSVLEDIYFREGFYDHLLTRNGSNQSELISFTNVSRLYEENPSIGFLVATNSKLTKESIGSTIPNKARSSVVRMELKKFKYNSTLIKMNNMANIQLNSFELHASKEKDILVSIARENLKLLLLNSDDNFDNEIPMFLSKIEKWNSIFTSDSMEALLYFVWRFLITHNLYVNELDKTERLEALTTEQSQIVFTNFILNLTKDGKQINDICFYKIENNTYTNCKLMITFLFKETINFIEKELGKNRAYWKYGYLHRIILKHTVFGLDSSSSVSLLKLIFNREIPCSGSYATVKKTGLTGEIFAREYSAIRIIADMSNYTKTWFSLSPGQSSNIFSLNYDDLIESHEKGQYFQIGEDREIYLILFK